MQSNEETLLARHKYLCWLTARPIAGSSRMQSNALQALLLKGEKIVWWGGPPKDYCSAARTGIWFRLA
jgi:hypothetical protein